ncbi:MAG: hypothetical protein V3T43_06300 [Nitrosomonadaceae bacterium]
MNPSPQPKTTPLDILGFHMFLPDDTVDKYYIANKKDYLEKSDREDLKDLLENGVPCKGIQMGAEQMVFLNDTDAISYFGCAKKSLLRKPVIETIKNGIEVPIEQ